MSINSLITCTGLSVWGRKRRVERIRPAKRRDEETTLDGGEKERWRDGGEIGKGPSFPTSPLESVCSFLRIRRWCKSY